MERKGSLERRSQESEARSQELEFRIIFTAKDAKSAKEYLEKKRDKNGNH